LLSGFITIVGGVHIINPTIFRVSRVSLDSINRLVNIEKHALNFVEEFMALKEAIFWVYTFPFVLFYEDD
jgi:hypothetical protein